MHKLVDLVSKITLTSGLVIIIKKIEKSAVRVNAIIFCPCTCIVVRIVLSWEMAARFFFYKVARLGGTRSTVFRRCL
jgi:hypothetical protein